MSAHLTQQKNALLEAFNNLTEPSQSGTFVFQQYTKFTVSQDGYVFWVAGANTVTVTGALHISTDREQEIDDTIAMNSVMLDTQDQVLEFNSVDTSSLWVAEISTPDGTGSVQIAFQRRGPWFENAGVYHYMGFAVFAPFADILVSSESDLPTGPIVSNSLPIWLAAAQALPTLVTSQAPAITLYPSFLVPENLQPPYGVVHIEPDLTKPIQQFPRHEWSQRTGSGPYQLPDTQLMRDRVEIVLYGLNNQQSRQWLNGLIAYSKYIDNFGFMSAVGIRDDKRTQAEIMAIALKKTIAFTASYYSGTADALLRQLILSATVSFNTSI